jgi:hypothetical protein
MMEAARTSETLVNFYQTTRRYNPEDNHLRNQRDLFSDCHIRETTRNKKLMCWCMHVRMHTCIYECLCYVCLLTLGNLRKYSVIRDTSCFLGLIWILVTNLLLKRPLERQSWRCRIILKWICLIFVEPPESNTRTVRCTSLFHEPFLMTYKLNGMCTSNETTIVPM